jgi:phenylacetate-CoA ligase
VVNINKYFDEAKETMPIEDRQRYYDTMIMEFVNHAYKSSPFIKKHFDTFKVNPDKIHGVKDLQQIPIIKKEQIREAHRLSPPFGGLITVPWEGLQRVYVSPGPIYDPEPRGERRLQEAKALYSLGFRKGDRVMVTLSFHLVPAGLLFDDALKGIGAIVIPSGVGNTDVQLGLMQDLQVTGYIGTAAFLLNLINIAKKMKVPFGEKILLKKALLTAERVPKSLRKIFEEDYGISTGEAYGTAEVGMFAYECPEKSGMHVGEDVFVEIVDPATGIKMPEGESGEIVVTHFSRTFPLIRFGTGDISYMQPGQCPCGRSSPRLGGIVGRVGDSFKVRGMFLHEPQIQKVINTVQGITNGSLLVTSKNKSDWLTFRVELDNQDVDKEKVERLLKENFTEICRLKINRIEYWQKGTIGSDQKALIDQRDWD